MTTDPYKPPDSDLDVPETLPPRPVRGILIGLVIDLGGTILLVFISSIIYGVVLASGGASQSEIESSITNMGPDSIFGIVNTILGLLMSFIGGFYCARIARAKDYLYPGIMAAILFLLSIILGWGTMSLILLVSLSMASVVAIMLGARIHLAQK